MGLVREKVIFMRELDGLASSTPLTGTIRRMLLLVVVLGSLLVRMRRA